MGKVAWLWFGNREGALKALAGTHGMVGIPRHESKDIVGS